MAELFEKTSINNLCLKNRFVRSATGEGMADNDGQCTEKIFSLMSDLAKGGVGLIITGHAFVNLDGRMLQCQTGAHSDKMLPGLSKMADTAQKNGANIILQLNHSGCYSMKDRQNNNPAGPSASSLEKNGIPNCREMKKKEIANTIKDFGNAAIRAKKAGFDGVQIHAAHNSLLSQFLSPSYNRRTDEYGGSLQNRQRIIFEIYEAFRTAVGNSFPFLIKINSDEFIDGGYSVKDMLHLATRLQKAGVDAIELSGGTRHPLGKYPVARIEGSAQSVDEAYYQEAAIKYKKEIDVPLILVGGIRSFETASLLLNRGMADYISLCRPLIREPDLIKRWQQGRLQRSTCISCNRCYQEGHSGRGVSCARDKKQNLNTAKMIG